MGIIQSKVNKVRTRLNANIAFYMKGIQMHLLVYNILYRLLNAMFRLILHRFTEL